MTKQMPEGFPKTKKPKKVSSGWLKPMSDKTKSRIAERKQVVEDTHKRAKGQCETGWIAPDIRCSKVRHADEKFTRGRSGGTTQYSTEYTQSICSYCDFVKENEIWASEILGLYGEQGKTKHIPITEADIERAKILFAKAKSRLCF